MQSYSIDTQQVYEGVGERERVSAHKSMNEMRTRGGWVPENTLRGRRYGERDERTRTKTSSRGGSRSPLTATKQRVSETPNSTGPPGSSCAGLNRTTGLLSPGSNRATTLVRKVLEIEWGCADVYIHVRVQNQGCES